MEQACNPLEQHLTFTLLLCAHYASFWLNNEQNVLQTLKRIQKL